MIPNIRGCVVHNDFWTWPISSRSFSHDFTIKLLKYGTSCRVCSTACTVLDGFSSFFAQMITSMRGCVVCSDLRPSRIYSRSFRYEFAIKLLKYCTSCCVCSTAIKILDWLFLYLARMITNMGRCVTCNDLWPSPISWRLFSCEIAYFMDYIHMWPKCNPGGDLVGQRSRSFRSFTFLQLGRGYPSKPLIYNM